MKLRHRSVGGIAARVTLLGPGAALLIVIANLVTFLEQLAVKLLASGFAQRFVINKRGKPRFDTHADQFSWRSWKIASIEIV